MTLVPTDRRRTPPHRARHRADPPRYVAGLPPVPPAMLEPYVPPRPWWRRVLDGRWLP